MVGHAEKQQREKTVEPTPELEQSPTEEADGYGNSWWASMLAVTGGMGEPVDPQDLVASRRAEVELANQQIASVEALLANVEAAIPGLEAAAQTAPEEEQAAKQSALNEARIERDLYRSDLDGLRIRRDQAQVELARAETLASAPPPPEYREGTKVRKDGTIDVALEEEPVREPERDVWGWERDPWGESDEERRARRAEELEDAKVDEARKLAAPIVRTEADQAVIDGHRDKVLEAANVAHKALQTNLGKGDSKALLSALHGLNGKKDLDVFWQAYQDANPELAGKDRDEVEAHLDARLLTNLHPADWAEAKAHLDGDVIEATNVGLQNAIGDEAFLERSNKRHAAAMSALRKKMGTGEAAYSWARQFTVGHVESGLDQVARSVDDKEERCLELMANLSTAQRAKLLVDDDFQAIRADVDESLNGTLDVDAGSTTVQQWNAYAHDQKLLDDARFQRDCARHAIEVELREEGITEDVDLHVRARLGRLRSDDVAWSRRIEERYGLTLKGEVQAAKMRQNLHGTGEWTDYKRYVGFVEEETGVNLDSDKKAQDAQSEELRRDPALAEATAKAYAANAGQPGLSGDAALKVVRDDVLAEADERDGTWVDLVAPYSMRVRSNQLEEETATTREATVAALDDTELAVAQARTGKELAKLNDGRQPADEEIAAWAKEKGPRGDLARTALAQKEGRETLAARERAAQIVGAAQRGEVTAKGGLIDLLADPAYRDGIEALDREIANGAVKPDDAKTRREKLEAAHRKRNERIDAAVVELTSGKEKAYGGVDDLLAREVSNWDAATITPDKQRFAKLAWQNGYLERHEQIFLAIDGAGTDKVRLAEATAGRTPDEIRDIADKFRRDFGDEKFYTLSEHLLPFGMAFGDQRIGEQTTDLEFLEGAIGADTSGRDEHDAKLGLMGDPKAVFDPEKPPADPKKRRKLATERLDLELRRMRAGYDLERGSGKGVLGGAYDDVEDVQEDLGIKDASGRRLDAQQKRLDDWLFSKESKDGESWVRRLEAGDPAAWKEFQKHKRWQETDVEVNGKMKSEAADIVQKALEAAAVIGTTIASGGTAGPLWAALFALGAAGTGALVKRGLMGDAYGEEEAGTQVGKAVVAVALERFVGNEVAKAMLGALADGLFDERTLRSDSPLQILVPELLKAGGKTALSKAAMADVDARLAKTKLTLAEQKVVSALVASGAGTVAKGDLSVSAVVGGMFDLGMSGAGADIRHRKQITDLRLAPHTYDAKTHGSLKAITDPELAALERTWTPEELARAGVDNSRISFGCRERAQRNRDLALVYYVPGAGTPDPTTDDPNFRLARMAALDREALRHGQDTTAARLRHATPEVQATELAKLPDDRRREVEARLRADDRYLAEAMIEAPDLAKNLSTELRGRPRGAPGSGESGEDPRRSARGAPRRGRGRRRGARRPAAAGARHGRRSAGGGGCGVPGRAATG